MKKIKEEENQDKHFNFENLTYSEEKSEEKSF